MSARAPLARLLAAALLAACAAGCGSASKTSGPGAHVGTQQDVANMLDTAYVRGALPPPNADGSASLLAAMDVHGLRAAAALFVSGSGFPSAGTVSVRTTPPAQPPQDVALDVLTTDYQGSPAYAYTTLVSHPLGVALAFDGAAYQRFTVSGSAAVPAFVDSVQSVTVPAVSAPADAAAAPRGSDLVVAWSDAGADTTVYVTCAVTSLVDSSQVAVGTLVRDVAGTATIPAARLGALPAGAARLAVARYRLVYHVLAGHRTGLASEGTTVQGLTLN